MEYTQREHTLSVLPTLVYGTPPRARVDDGKLVHIEGAVPLRDEDAEKRLVHKLRDELNQHLAGVFHSRESFRIFMRDEGQRHSLVVAQGQSSRAQGAINLRVR